MAGLGGEIEGKNISLITYPALCGMRMRWKSRNTNSGTCDYGEDEGAEHEIN